MSAVPITPQPAQTTDPRWSPPERLSALDRFFLPKMRDERDLIFVHRATSMLTWLVPAAVVMFLLPHWAVAVVAVPYLVFTMLRFAGPYTLMLHATSHRVLFRRDHAAWNRVIPWLIGPFFGHTPTSFYVHHIGMHHPENNLQEDLSSTMQYTRDRFGHWLHYWASFFFTGLGQLLLYLRQRRHRKLARKLIQGELAWLVVVGALLVLNWPATLVVFVAPLLLMRTLMMCGNFAQHAFVDLDDAANPYRNSSTLINTHYNHKCYNDGYHVVHHIKPNLHWSEMAQWYDDHREEFARHDAIVFDGLRDNQQVWLLLMTGNYDRLAQHVVNFHHRSHDELVRLLKSRTRHRAVAAPRLARG